MTNPSEVQPKRFLGWWIVFVCVLVTAVRAGVGFQTLGFIIKPMQADLGWTATVITACVTGQNVVASLIAPLVGRLLDRFGGRTVVTFGAACDGLTLVLMSQVTEVWQFALVMGLLGGFAEACVGNALLMPFISKWFIRHRGLAMGMVATGSNLGGVLISPIVVILTHHLGWRGAWFCVGLIPIVLITPLAGFILRAKPEDLGSGPDGDLIPAAVAKTPDVSFTVKQALRTRSFWMLLLAWNLTDFAAKGALLNKIPYSTELGFSPASVAGVIAVFGISSIIGKVLVGWTADRFNPRVVGSLLGLVESIGLFLFVGSTSLTRMMLTYGVLGGFCSGGLIALLPVLMADYFGRRNQGAIGGITVPMLLISSFGGPLLAARVADVTGSYAGGFLCYAIVAAAGGIVLIFVRRPAALPNQILEPTTALTGAVV